MWISCWGCPNQMPQPAQVNLSKSCDSDCLCNAQIPGFPLSKKEKEQVVFSEKGLKFLKMSLALEQTQGCTLASPGLPWSKSPIRAFPKRALVSFSYRLRGNPRIWTLHQTLQSLCQKTRSRTQMSLHTNLLLSHRHWGKLS